MSNAILDRLTSRTYGNKSKSFNTPKYTTIKLKATILNKQGDIDPNAGNYIAWDGENKKEVSYGNKLTIQIIRVKRFLYGGENGNIKSSEYDTRKDVVKLYGKVDGKNTTIGTDSIENLRAQHPTLKSGMFLYAILDDKLVRIEVRGGGSKKFGDFFEAQGFGMTNPIFTKTINIITEKVVGGAFPYYSPVLTIGETKDNFDTIEKYMNIIDGDEITDSKVIDQTNAEVDAQFDAVNAVDATF